MWLENDSLGNFSEFQTLITYPSFHHIYFNDIDNDTDLDILNLNGNTNIITWFRNDGQGNFLGQQDIASLDETDIIISFVDLNGNSNRDILTKSYSGETISWYENLGTLSLNQNTLLNLSIYPNPTKNILKINSNTTISQIEIYNELGVVVLSNLNKNNIDISTLDQGLYFIKVKDENDIYGIHKIIKE